MPPSSATSAAPSRSTTRIAERMGLTRRQVINLRKAARRLARGEDDKVAVTAARPFALTPPAG
ncbi:MAG TPA: hypothetical protein VG148_15340 [Pyrinomonadaceae bacterium]|nr:hypothetical protein [Pyrinomonadaceae bacterium]